MKIEHEAGLSVQHSVQLETRQVSLTKLLTYIHAQVKHLILDGSSLNVQRSENLKYSRLHQKVSCLHCMVIFGKGNFGSSPLRMEMFFKLHKFPHVQDYPEDNYIHQPYFC